MCFGIRFFGELNVCHNLIFYPFISLKMIMKDEKKNEKMMTKKTNKK